MCLTYVETRLRRVLPLQVAAGAVAATAAAAASAMPGLSSDGNPTGSPPPGRWNVLPPWLLTPRPPAPRSTPGSSGGGRGTSLRLGSTRPGQGRGPCSPTGGTSSPPGFSPTSPPPPVRPPVRPREAAAAAESQPPPPFRLQPASSWPPPPPPPRRRADCGPPRTWPGRPKSALDWCRHPRRRRPGRPRR